MRSPKDQPSLPRTKPPHAAALALLFPLLLSAPAALPAADPLPAATLAAALRASLLDPDRLPGVNDWTCVPPAAHPHPVVLVHGTFENLAFNWTALAPVLKEAGYCVFALTYGRTAASLGGRIGGAGDIAASAAELGAFIDRVLAATGASQVDIVGHSQGGMMPLYYIKRLGGAPRVRTLVALSPSNHGTNLSRLLDLGQTLGLIGGFNAAAQATPSLVQQQRGSAFMTALFADGDTVPGPRYLVIQTRHDAVVTPYTQAFLHGPGVRNLTLQDQCPEDPTGHIGIPFDGPAIQNVLNALGPDDPRFQARCDGYGPPL